METRIEFSLFLISFLRDNTSRENKSLAEWMFAWYFYFFFFLVLFPFIELTDKIRSFEPGSPYIYHYIYIKAVHDSIDHVVLNNPLMIVQKIKKTSLSLSLLLVQSNRKIFLSTVRVRGDRETPREYQNLSPS